MHYASDFVWHADKYQLSQMDPRDALPHTHRAVQELDAQCDTLHGQARQSNVDRRKYCQLSSTDRNLGNFFSILCIPNKSLNCALSGGIRSDNLGNF